MEEQTVELLNEVVKNAEMGRTTAHQLLSIAQENEMKDHLHKELATYEDVAKRAHAMLAVEGLGAKTQSKLTKWSAHMGIAMKTMTDQSSQKLADMLIQGAQMGVTDMTKAIKANPDANPGAVALAQRLQHAENEYLGELKAFL